MSALDQAFIKAYGKPTARPPSTERAAVTSAATATVVRRAPAPAAAAAAIEAAYSEGALYRVDLPASGAAATRRLSAVPAPHHLAAGGSAGQAASQRLVPPPTSPKRGMRRSVLRLLAGQPQETPALEPATAPRIQRKVIIRHVAHAQHSAGLVPPPHIAAQGLSADLPPEFATELPTESAAPPLDPLTLPALPGQTGAAPLNELDFASPAALVQGHWDDEPNGAQPLVVFSESTSLADSETFVSVQLESLLEPQQERLTSLAEESSDEVVAVETGEAESIGFATKSLDDDRRSSARIDPPHARSTHRPHVRFPVPAELTPEEAESLTADLPTIHEPSAPAMATRPAMEAPLTECRVDEAPAAAESPLPFAPPPTAVWEVDQFKWPRVCERLLADEQGYLQGAGEKLLAAVNDGLKTLAVTGSRRGEGRTTLALCLARVAAKAGIRVVVLDADFARPQVASRLGLEISHGWQDVALGSIPLNEAAIKSLQDSVTVLPLEITAIRRSLSLSDPRVTGVLREATSAFDLVIIDLGPLGPGEVCAFPPGEACPIDAAIVVRDLRFATAHECQDVGERLYDAGIEAVGIAENFVEDSSAVQ
jgi:Mrp family chromosome partitioning ATPase